jgi:hypothetical protein
LHAKRCCSITCIDLDIALNNLLSPPVLFFVLGLFAAIVRSDLDLPAPIPKLLSLLLLMSIGFKGGVGLASSPFSSEVVTVLGLAMLLACVVPVIAFFVLRWKVSITDAAAIAATYGSVSAVTFVTAIDFLERQQIAFGGHMVAAMSLMESPAIVVGILLARVFGSNSAERPPWGKVMHESLLNGPVLLLVGSLVIGTVATLWRGVPAVYEPVNEIIFPVVLMFFLLDLGLLAGRRLKDLRRLGGFLGVFAFAMPLAAGAMGCGLSQLVGLAPGDALLLTILAASASYIAVPAAMRIALPSAEPGVYVTMALTLTFPFNIIAGIPLWWAVIN